MRRLRTAVAALALAATLAIGVGGLTPDRASAHTSGYECWGGYLYSVTYNTIPVQPYWAGNHYHTVATSRNLYIGC